MAIEKTYWYPVYQAKKLKRKPVRIEFKGFALLLFRTHDTIACLGDICPHRFASLSNGRLKNDTIACPYHGLQFDGKGRLKHMPVCEDRMPKLQIKHYDVCQMHGLIFITESAENAQELYIPMWDEQAAVYHVVESDAYTTLADAAENVLDPVHTLFVHKGLIRGLSEGGTEISLKVSVKNSVLEMFYAGEKNQDGLLSKLLEGERSHSISRFLMPGVVELQYWGLSHLNLVTTLYFVPLDKNRFKSFAIMKGPRKWGLGYLKAFLFVVIMKKVIAQDIDIMTNATENWEQAGEPRRALLAFDLVRKYLEIIIEDDQNTIINLPERYLNMKV